jgi:phosphoenolpyruvate-protein phosphotransferase (PTS system enzyme I)
MKFCQKGYYLCIDDLCWDVEDGTSLPMHTPHSNEEVTWKGIPVSDGVAEACVHVLRDAFDEPAQIPISAEEVNAQLQRLDEALHATRNEILELQRRMAEHEQDSEAADIFETHLLLLDDVSVLEHVRRTVRNKLLNVDAVYHQLMRKHIDALRGVDDPYLRERYIDLKDVTQRVMRHLRGEQRADLSFDQPVIIAAHDLTPSDTVAIDRSKVAGFAIEAGSANSHVAIIARSLGVPAVVRLAGICNGLHTGEHIVLDGSEGLLIQRPRAETVSRYELIEAEMEAQEDLLEECCHDPATTQDGRTICVGANAEFADELDFVIESGAEEVGLFRTEFGYLEEPDASEEMLSEFYSNVVKKMDQRLVVFRTLDLGGDKLDPLLAASPEPNPFLGWRGIRVSLGRVDFFKRQIRALLRAGCHGPIGIMFPMVSGVEEVRAAKAILLECQQELQAAGVCVPEQLQIGAMIEVPSAACTADLIAEEVDFLSLGTNDLIQYTIAVDRLNERVADLYQATHPGVLRLIQNVCNAGRSKGVRVCMCGEMAGDIELTPLLIGMGLDELSVTTGQVPRVKQAIRKLQHEDCAKLAQRVAQMSCPHQIRSASLELAEKAYAELVA